MQKTETKVGLALTGERDGLVDSRKRAVSAKRFRLELRKQAKIKRLVQSYAAIDHCIQRPFKSLRSGMRIVEMAIRPARRRFGPVALERHPVFPAEGL